MKLLRPRTFIIFALAGLSGTVLLHTSQNVQQAEERLEALELSIYREEEKIRMLRAEWQALNHPERLERLANEFLDLVPPSPDQISDNDSVLPDPASGRLVPDHSQIDGFEPIFRPVTFAAEKSAAPAPPRKPSIKPHIPSRPQVKPPKNKAFGDLLDELGGGR